jgi:N-acyl homoserine lactone hydrolase
MRLRCRDRCQWWRRDVFGNLRAERTDGVTNDPQTAVASLRAINEFAAGEPTIILPAHDPGVPARLAAVQS